MEYGLSLFHSALKAIAGNTSFMFWNSFLALVPLTLALLLYTRYYRAAAASAALCIVLFIVKWQAASSHLVILYQAMPTMHVVVLGLCMTLLAILALLPRYRQDTVLAVGTASFLLFLPNAPYVLTDLVHLAEAIRAIPHTVALLIVALPLYIVFMVVGFSSYVISLSVFSAHVESSFPRVPRRSIEIAIHALSAFGVYLGRFVRLNSWDVATQPMSVVKNSVGVVQSAEAVILIALSFVATWLLFEAWRVVLRAFFRYVQRRFLVVSMFFRTYQKSEL